MGGSHSFFLFGTLVYRQHCESRDRLCTVKVHLGAASLSSSISWCREGRRVHLSYCVILCLGYSRGPKDQKTVIPSPSALILAPWPLPPAGCCRRQGRAKQGRGCSHPPGSPQLTQEGGGAAGTAGRAGGSTSQDTGVTTQVGYPTHTMLGYHCGCRGIA